MLERKWKLAEPKFLEAVKVLGGRREHHYAMTARELGAIASAKNDWRTARKYFQEDYDIQVADLGPEDSAVILPLTRVALADLRLKNIPAAQAEISKALEIQKKQLMPNAENEANLLEKLAMVHLEAGEPEIALKHAKRSAELWLSPKVGASGSGMLSIWRTLGSSYMATNHFKEAEECFTKARNISDSYGFYSDQVQDRVDIARSCEKQGAIAKADRFYKEALRHGNKALKECRTLPHAQEQLKQTQHHMRAVYMTYAEYLDRQGKTDLAQQMRTKASQELSKS